RFSWEQSVGDSTNLTVQFFGPETDDIIAMFWDFGDGNTSEAGSPQHNYLNEGLYYVTLHITNASGCESSSTQSIYVGEGCACPEFYDPVCVIDPNTGELLTFGNHCFAECEGYYDYFHCDDDGGENDNFCQAMFWFNTEDNLTIQFEDLSMTTDETIAWEWDFGDENTSNETNPVHIYAEEGIYFVTLTVRDAELCSSRFSMLVWTSEDVFYSEDCRALFFPIIQDNQVILLDVSQGNVNSWEWDLGDGTTANGPFVQHVYDAEGEVTITLKITTEDGCESEFAIILNLDSGNFHGASDPEALSTSTDELSILPTGMKIFPNPITTVAQLHINSVQSTDYQMVISDVTGQVIQQSTVQIREGVQTIEVDMASFAKGIYVITMRSAEQVWSEKVIKL
ncbi:MAG: PKD domain-containing protein, partial [Saprospiraceae bacterium]